MTTERKTRGVKPSTVIYTEGVDPMVVQLRTEQVRQGLSDYALSLATGIGASKLGNMWRGAAPTLRSMRTVADALRKGNASFKLHDP